MSTFLENTPCRDGSFFNLGDRRDWKINFCIFKLKLYFSNVRKVLETLKPLRKFATKSKIKPLISFEIRGFLVAETGLEPATSGL